MSENLDGFMPDLAARVEAVDSMPEMPRSMLQRGDTLLLFCLGSDGNPCTTEFGIDVVGKEEASGFSEVLVTALSNTSRSPIEIGARYFLAESCLSPTGSLMRVNSSLKTGTYQFLNPLDDAGHSLRTSYIENVAILRGEDTITASQV